MSANDLTQINVPVGAAPGAVRVSRIHRITECANLTCFNRSDEGAFAAVTIHPPSGRHRAVTLLLCVPCVEAVAAVIR